MSAKFEGRIVSPATTVLLSASLALTVLGFAHGATAAIVGALGGGFGVNYSITNAGLDNGAFASLSGGSVYSSDQGFAHPPEGLAAGENYLAAGTQAGQPATLTFASGVTYFSFDWGSPDVTNTLEFVSSTAGIYDFSPTSMGFPVVNGAVNFSQYVEFFTNTPGETIVSAAFSNAEATNSFEATYFNGLRSSGSAAPEPASWALMLLGFGGLGTVLRRHRHRAAFVTG
jgi:hypothetical protein